MPEPFYDSSSYRDIKEVLDTLTVRQVEAVHGLIFSGLGCPEMICAPQSQDLCRGTHRRLREIAQYTQELMARKREEDGREQV
jgi:hypothetical protein